MLSNVVKMRKLEMALNSTSLFFPKRWKEKTEVPFQSELKNPVAEVYGAAEAWPDDEVRRPSFRSDI